LLAYGVEHANETALISGEHGHQSAQRIGERTDELCDELELGRELGQDIDLFGVDDATVNVGGLYGDLFDAVAEGLERFGRRDRVGTGEDDAGRSGQKRFQLGREVAGGDAKERVFLRRHTSCRPYAARRAAW